MSKQILGKDQKGVVFVLELVAILIVLSFIGLVVYKVYKDDSQEAQNVFGLDQDISLRTRQSVTISNGDELIKFRFTEIRPASNPKARCEEFCVDWLPTIKTELEYAGKTFIGTSTSDTGSIDMSFGTNGAYPLVPYNIKLVSTDFKESSATVNIIKKEFIRAEIGKPFTLKNNDVAALEPGKTGTHIRFGTCGFESPCIREIDFYVNDEYVSVPLGFADSEASPDLQFASKDGSYAEHDDIRLRIIESDDRTYATFIFEHK